MAKKKLIKNGGHRGPLLAVIRRAGVGSPDKFERGLWLSFEDVLKVEEYIRKTGWKHSSGVYVVDGTNRHNHIVEGDCTAVWEGRQAY